MTEPDLRFLGMVEVDSGTLLIGDPGYVLPRAAHRRPGVDYQAVIDADDTRFATYLAGQPALLLQRFGGDGSFPVFGEFEDGELIGVRIHLDPPVDDEEEGTGD